MHEPNPTSPDLAAILNDESVRREACCQAELRATYHQAWRDPVRVLDRLKEKRGPEFGGDEDDTDNDRDNDYHKDEKSGAAADTSPDSVVVDEPVTAQNGADEFLAIDPEKAAEQSAQLTNNVVVSINHPVAPTEGAKAIRVRLMEQQAN